VPGRAEGKVGKLNSYILVTPISIAKPCLNSAPRNKFKSSIKRELADVLDFIYWVNDKYRPRWQAKVSALNCYEPWQRQSLFNLTNTKASAAQKYELARYKSIRKPCY